MAIKSARHGDLSPAAPPAGPPPGHGRTPSSSAAASAGSRRRSGSARAATGSRCWSGSSSPAAAPTCHRQDGFTFDAGPTIVTAPFLFEELWALCGRRLADDVDLRPVVALLPHPLPRRRAPSTTRGDPARDARARWRGSRPATSRATSASCAQSEAIFRVGFEQLGARALRLAGRHGADRARPGAARQGYRTRATAWSPRTCATRGCASVLSFHPLLVGGNPFTTTVDLRAHRLPRAALGRAFRRWAAPGALVQGLVELIEGQGGAVRCGAEVERDHRRGRRGDAACGWRRASAIAADVVVSNADSAWTYRHLRAAEDRAAAGPTGASSARATR